jgi:thiamine-phosphate pyrophosphorylase
MGATGRSQVEAFFEHLSRGDVEAALAGATDDVLVDTRNSTAPWRGISHGRDEVRRSFEAFQEAWSELGGVDWDHTQIRAVAPHVLAVESRLKGRGPMSGLRLEAHAGFVVALRSGKIAEATLHQTLGETLLAARRRAFAEARLYFVCEGLPHGRDPTELLAAAVRGGAGVIQLREKSPRCAEEVLALAEPFRRVAEEHGALFILNDMPELVAQTGADGVHVGQDDAGVAEARGEAGAHAVVGLSTHSVEQLDAARAATGASRPDQVSVGPVWETPTKEGRRATGLELIEHAARGADDPPWFAIGGIDRGTVGQVAAAGARRAVVVRAIRDADDPEAAARELRAALTDTQAE